MVLGAAVGTALSVCITEWVIQPNVPESYARTILSGCIGLILGFHRIRVGSLAVPEELFGRLDQSNHKKRMCCNFVVEPKAGVEDRHFSSSPRTGRE
jgi:hypothetical protein